MSLFGALNVDLVSNLKGSAHPKQDIGHGYTELNAKDNNLVSLHDKDVVNSQAVQRVEKVLNVELSMVLLNAEQNAFLYRESEGQAIGFDDHVSAGFTLSNIANCIDVDKTVANLCGYFRQRMARVAAQGGDEITLKSLLANLKDGLHCGMVAALQTLDRLGDLEPSLVTVLSCIEQRVCIESTPLSGEPNACQSINALLPRELEGPKQPLAAKLSVLPFEAQDLHTDWLLSRPNMCRALHTFSYDVKPKEPSIFPDRLQARLIRPSAKNIAIFDAQSAQEACIAKGECYELHAHTLQGELITVTIQHFSHNRDDSLFTAPANYSNMVFGLVGMADRAVIVALNDLFAQVNQLADAFFDARLEEALDFDLPEHFPEHFPELPDAYCQLLRATEKALSEHHKVLPDLPEYVRSLLVHALLEHPRMPAMYKEFDRVDRLIQNAGHIGSAQLKRSFSIKVSKSAQGSAIANNPQYEATLATFDYS